MYMIICKYVHIYINHYKPDITIRPINDSPRVTHAFLVGLFVQMVLSDPDRLLPLAMKDSGEAKKLKGQSSLKCF